MPDCVNTYHKIKDTRTFRVHFFKRLKQLKIKKLKTERQLTCELGKLHKSTNVF